MATSFMNLNLPTPTVTIGPDWAVQLNTALNVVDSHDHSSGKGVKVKPAGLDINASLPFNNNSALSLRSAAFQAQAATLTGVSNANSLYSVNGNLYFTNAAGTAVQLTSGASIIATPSNVTNLSYTSIAANLTIANTDTFVVIGVDTTAARTITLPLASTVTPGRFYVVKDITGNADTEAISVAASGADLVDGLATYSFDSSYGSIHIISNGLDAWYVF